MKHCLRYDDGNGNEATVDGGWSASWLTSLFVEDILEMLASVWSSHSYRLCRECWELIWFAHCIRWTSRTTKLWNCVPLFNYCTPNFTTVSLPSIDVLRMDGYRSQSFGGKTQQEMHVDHRNPLLLKLLQSYCCPSALSSKEVKHATTSGTSCDLFGISCPHTWSAFEDDFLLEEAAHSFDLCWIDNHRSMTSLNPGIGSASPSSPALLLEDAADSVSHVIVHPLVLLHVLDHHTRRQEASGRVIGTLLGRRDGRTVSQWRIWSSFPGLSHICCDINKWISSHYVYWIIFSMFFLPFNALNRIYVCYGLTNWILVPG